MEGPMSSPVRAVGILVTLVISLISGSKIVRAAEILCAHEYGQENVRPIISGLAVERARRWWPSGFRPSPDSCLEAMIRGTIESGDYDRFKVFFRQHYRALFNVTL